MRTRATGSFEIEAMRRAGLIDSPATSARKAAESKEQAEIEHRAKPNRRLDDDEMRAACGLPPRRPLEAA